MSGRQVADHLDELGAVVTVLTRELNEVAAALLGSAVLAAAAVI